MKLLAICALIIVHTTIQLSENPPERIGEIQTFNRFQYVESGQFNGSIYRCFEVTAKYGRYIWSNKILSEKRIADAECIDK